MVRRWDWRTGIEKVPLLGRNLAQSWALLLVLILGYGLVEIWVPYLEEL